MSKTLVKVVRRSPFSGETNQIEVLVNHEDIEKYNGGELIQNCFPYLTADEREFIKTGITPEEWAETFGN